MCPLHLARGKISSNPLECQRNRQRVRIYTVRRHRQACCWRSFPQTKGAVAMSSLRISMYAYRRATLSRQAAAPPQVLWRAPSPGVVKLCLLKALHANGEGSAFRSVVPRSQNFNLRTDNPRHALCSDGGNLTHQTENASPHTDAP